MQKTSNGRLCKIFTLEPTTIKLINDLLPKRTQSVFVEKAILDALVIQKEQLLLLRATKQAKKDFQQGKIEGVIKDGKIEIELPKL